jgi:hypothetical protein
MITAVEDCCGRGSLLMFANLIAHLPLSLTEPLEWGPRKVSVSQRERTVWSVMKSTWTVLVLCAVRKAVHLGTTCDSGCGMHHFLFGYSSLQWATGVQSRVNANQVKEENFLQRHPPYKPSQRIPELKSQQHLVLRPSPATPTNSLNWWSISRTENTYIARCLTVNNLRDARMDCYLLSTDVQQLSNR